MKFNNKIYSSILVGCLTLVMAGAVSAHQSLTMNAMDAAQNGNFNLRFEPQYGRMIIGAGIINENNIEYEANGYVSKTNVSGLELLFGGRKYLNQFGNRKGDKFSGVFFEGDLALQTAKMTYTDRYDHNKDRDKTQTYTTITALAGYKFISGYKQRSGLTVEAVTGPRFNIGDEFYGYREYSTEVVAMINMGYTWGKPGTSKEKSYSYTSSKHHKKR